MKQPDDADEKEKPTKYFERKIAGLILKGRFSRAQREIQRWNHGNRAHVKLLPYDQAVAWAKTVLENPA